MGKAALKEFVVLSSSRDSASWDPVYPWKIQYVINSNIYKKEVEIRENE